MTRPADQAAEPSRATSAIAGRLCEWCGGPIPRSARADAEVCGVVCRKRRWRFRRAIRPADRADASRGTAAERDASRLQPSRVDAGRFAYADPPYPGKAHLYPERTEVDHAELVERLERDYPDGWALSTSAAALGAVLRLCPPEARVCIWRRRVRFVRSTRALNAWEPLIVVRGRPLAADAVQDLLDVLEAELLVDDPRELDSLLDYRGRYDSLPDALVGMKPPEFSAWLFRQLGARPGDELADLFPGSGAIGRAWAVYASPEYSTDASRLISAGRVPSRLEMGRVPEDLRDA
jgi:hypothetical protein